MRRIFDSKSFEPFYPAPYEEKAVRCLSYDDFHKLCRVKLWALLDNPVMGSCRRCGFRGLVDDPEAGIY